jgi:hypothetical protein
MGAWYENVCRKRLDHDVEWRHSHEISVGLHRTRRIRLDPQVATGCIEHAGIRSEVFA